METYFLIGPKPPPLGGISVYVDRFSRRLRDQGVGVRVVDPGKLSTARRLAFAARIATNPRPATYHINGFQLSIVLALVLRPFPGRIIFHDHSGRYVEGLSRFRRLALRLLFCRVDECILVNDHIVDIYKRNGLALPSQVKVESAFLPPPPEDESVIWQSYSSEVRQFVETRHPLIIANAFRITFYQGIDLYGLDMCVDLVTRLVSDYANVGLLFALADIGDREYYQLMNHRIEALGVRSHILFMTGQRELWPLFKKATVMVRPTCVDGSPVSVCEALYLGCPAVASDVCKRADGAVIFRSRDLDDFVSQVRRALGSVEERNGLLGQSIK